MGLFGNDSSSSSSVTVVSTNQVDQRAAAAEGSTLLAAYNKGDWSYTQIDASPQIAQAAIEGMAEVSTGATEANRTMATYYAEAAKTLGLGAFDFASQISQNIASLVNAQAAGAQAQHEQAAAMLGAVTELGKITATGGQSDTNKTLLSVVGLAMAGLVLFALAKT